MRWKSVGLHICTLCARNSGLTWRIIGRNLADAASRINSSLHSTTLRPRPLQTPETAATSTLHVTLDAKHWSTLATNPATHVLISHFSRDQSRCSYTSVHHYCLCRLTEVGCSRKALVSATGRLQGLSANGFRWPVPLRFTARLKPLCGQGLYRGLALSCLHRQFARTWGTGKRWPGFSGYGVSNAGRRFKDTTLLSVAPPWPLARLTYVSAAIAAGRRQRTVKVPSRRSPRRCATIVVPSGFC